MIQLVVTKDEITPTLGLMVERMQDFTVPLTAILSDGLASAQEQIVEGQGAAFGRGGWPEMSPATVRQGRDPGTLLLDSGRLVLSLSRGAAGNFFVVGPTEGTAGTNLVSERNGFPYAAVQQRGSKRYPPRPYLDWYEERFPIYDEYALNWIMSGEAGNA